MKQSLQKTSHDADIMKRHLIILFIIFISLFILLGIRLGVITATGVDNYEHRVLKQYITRETETKEIAPKRGAITDRFGTVLAESIKVYDVIYDPGVLNQKSEKVRNNTNRLIASVLGGVTEAQLNDYLKNKPTSHYIVLARELSYEDIRAIDEISSGKHDKLEDETLLKSYDIAGVFLEEHYQRLYPYDYMASHVIGFSNDGLTGSYGIEEYYNEMLSGKPGRIFGFVDEDAVINQEEIESQNGNTIRLTLDYTIQKYVEDALVRFDEEIGSKNSAVIVMNPKNAEILAMAAYPNYNLNQPKDLSHLIDEETLINMTQDEKTALSFSLWRNYNINDTYEPGSTYKALVLAAALEENKTALDKIYHCDGAKVVYDYYIQCYRHIAHGDQTIYDALANSCNVAFMTIAEDMGKDIFYDYHKMFGAGVRTNIDLVGEASAANVINAYSQMGPVELATSAFGQGFNLTPIQLITAFSSLLNEGYLYEPHVMKSIRDDEGHLLTENTPTLVRQIISEETSKIVIEAMLNAVEAGTGQKAAIEGYEIGGKTGTAEKLPRGNEKYVVSFMGFAAKEGKPELAVLVIVDEPDMEDPTSKLAADIFVDIMENALPYYKIFPAIDAKAQTPSN